MNKFNRVALTLSPLAMLLAGTAASAQDTASMATVVTAAADSKEYMGTALVAQGDCVLFDEAYGLANLEWDIANTTDTRFRIGSVTKQFTAVSILLLQQDGKLDIDAPIGTYLEDAPDTWNAISTRQLMNHTSGIPNITSFEDFYSWKFQPSTLDALIARFSDKPLDFAPGSKWAYSNSGYMLLAEIIEKVSGQKLADFMQRRIFDPLEMADTGADVTSTILPHRASGYSPSSEGIVNAEYVHMSIPQGGGNLYSTTADMLKWQRSLFGGRLLSAESLAIYTATVPHEAFGEAKYAAGVLVEEIDGRTTYWHGGGIEGFNSWLGYQPDSETTVVVLANLNGGSARQLGLELLRLAHTQPGAGE